jgi:hypothetical protein
MCQRDHEKMKQDPAAWAALPLVGTADYGDGEPVLELRNCEDCKSTLAVALAAQVAA